ncbi:amino acid transporter [Aspergillus ellipticus CBS 707.79]|uniref:Amino acid transporter n=1 Tax=Aspergillus ellipticus CBS 707.79 TaxID=1448320 RepID=A0A319EIU3_9EURO|nr:amino acid transporter [Aspergillus ellipticus CBS 707.79]
MPPSDPSHQHEGEPRPQESFQLWQLFGMMTAAQGTPIVIGSFLSLIVGVGGPPGYIWGGFTAGIFSILIMLSLAEICCVYPCPAGQVYWSGVLFRRGANRPASYACGWICTFGWHLWFGGVTILIAEYICAVAKIYHPAHIFDQWQIYLVNIAIIVLSLLWNGLLFKAFTKLTPVIIYTFNVGALFIFIALLVKATPKQSARTVFIDLLNETGWSNDGAVFLIATGPLTACLTAFDTAAHLADEVPNPSRTITIVMVFSTLINYGTGLAMSIAQMFCTTNLNHFLNPVGKQPLIQLFHDSLATDWLIITSCVIVIIAQIFCAICALTIAGRTLWAFANLNGTPYPAWLGQLDPRYALPMNAMYILTIATIAITAVSMGSRTALNAILNGGSICIFISYAFPITQLLVVGRKFLPADRHLNLGTFGLICNAVSALWIPFAVIMPCFPLYLPAMPNTMNYTSVIVGGIVIFGVINWVMNSRKIYVIPEWTAGSATAASAPGNSTECADMARKRSEAETL